MTEGRNRGSDRGKRQQKKWQERDRGEEKEGSDRAGEIRCVRHRVYRRINGRKETVVMRDRRETDGDSKGKDRGSDRGKRQEEKRRKKRQKGRDIGER